MSREGLRGARAVLEMQVVARCCRSIMWAALVRPCQCLFTMATGDTLAMSKHANPARCWLHCGHLGPRVLCSVRLSMYIRPTKKATHARLHDCAIAFSFATLDPDHGLSHPQPPLPHPFAVLARRLPRPHPLPHPACPHCGQES